MTQSEDEAVAYLRAIADVTLDAVRDNCPAFGEAKIVLMVEGDELSGAIGSGWSKGAEAKRDMAVAMLQHTLTALEANGFTRLAAKFKSIIDGNGDAKALRPRRRPQGTPRRRKPGR